MEVVVAVVMVVVEPLQHFVNSDKELRKEFAALISFNPFNHTDEHKQLVVVVILSSEV